MGEIGYVSKNISNLKSNMFSKKQKQQKTYYVTAGNIRYLCLRTKPQSVSSVKDPRVCVCVCVCTDTVHFACFFQSKKAHVIMSSGLNVENSEIAVGRCKCSSFLIGKEQSFL